ncbi:hypothetical protein BJY04DRAFT_231557 [Aspergillus karnatakaensis]|uniref:flavin-containing monooxygenase n=1 Tax=Aspergillus karnatakaensis TaxID=1810916 RepID=UPI003CCDAA7F
MSTNNPIHTERPIKIICIGAGASGLLFAYKLQRSFTNFNVTIYEKNADIAGTWFENRYPGCACDAPSHNYTWSFEPKSDWSATYAGSDEIFAYFDSFAAKYGLRRYIKVRHQVTHAEWSEGDRHKHKGGWELRVRDLDSDSEFVDTCDILINASGILNSWRWPNIPGIEEYKGTLVHTANWDDKIDLTGKHVGLIGNGSSAIQVLPAILPTVSKVTTFIRSPTWVSPVKGLESRTFTEEEKHAFATDSAKLTEYRRGIERGMSAQWAVFLRHTEEQRSTKEYMTAQLKDKLQNTHLENLLIPAWSVGCRRITPGVGYLEALGDSKTEVVFGDIASVTERGCVGQDGKEYPVNILICATGFDTSFRPRFPILGVDGVNLQDLWGAEPRSYFGIAAAGMPNYLMFLGPNSPIGNGPVLSAVEAQADYMMKMIDRYQTTNIKSFTPRSDAVDEFIEFKDSLVSKTVWVDECRSWYKSGTVDGPVTALWPGSTLHYLEAMAEPRMEDWEVQYDGNRFAWMGNGYSQTEIDETADWGYYIREKDDGEFHSRGKRLRILNKSGTRKPEGSAFAIFPKL